MSESESKKELLLALGLCARARKLIFGTDMVCDRLRSDASQIKLVIEASDTSDNTHKKINDKCAYYGARIVRINADAMEIGRATGKKRQVAVLAINDGALAELIVLKLGKEAR